MNRTVKYQGAFSRIVGFGGKRFLFSPPPSTFFCLRSNVRAITRLETLATQANFATLYFRAVYREFGLSCSNLRMDVQFTCNKIKALYEKSPVNVHIEPPSIFSFTRYTAACWVLDQNGPKNPYACVGRSSILCSTLVASIACLKQHTSRLFLSPFASLVTSRWPLKLKLWLCSKR